MREREARKDMHTSRTPPKDLEATMTLPPAACEGMVAGTVVTTLPVMTSVNVADMGEP